MAHSICSHFTETGFGFGGLICESVSEQSNFSRETGTCAVVYIGYFRFPLDEIAVKKYDLPGIYSATIYMYMSVITRKPRLTEKAV